MAVGGGAAMTRNVLDDGRDAAGHKPRRNRFGERDHLADVTPVSPVADDLVCAFDRQVERRARSSW